MILPCQYIRFLVYGSVNLKQLISQPKIVRVCYTRVFANK